jgi:hypothetical protein
MVDGQSSGQTNVGPTNIGPTNVGMTNIGPTNIGQTNIVPANVGSKKLETPPPWCKWVPFCPVSIF